MLISDPIVNKPIAKRGPIVFSFEIFDHGLANSIRLLSPNVKSNTNIIIEKYIW